MSVCFIMSVCKNVWMDSKSGWSMSGWTLDSNILMSQVMVYHQHIYMCVNVDKI